MPYIHGMDQINHDELAALVEEHGLTQQDVATLLGKATGDRVSLRTVQSWLNRQDGPAARRCPGWVIYVLRREL